MKSKKSTFLQVLRESIDQTKNSIKKGFEGRDDFIDIGEPKDNLYEFSDDEFVGATRATYEEFKKSTNISDEQEERNVEFYYKSERVNNPRLKS